MSDIEIENQPSHNVAGAPLKSHRLGAMQLHDGTPNHNNRTSFRASSTHQTVADRLGALKDLPGFWQGTGFSLIARPNFSGGNKNKIFLELNLLQETVEFTTIGSPVFNRGSLQDDIAIYGLTYLHRVTDAVTGGALHIEPGLWLNIPPTTKPQADVTVARLATIPHGNAVCTVGFVQEVPMDGNSQPDIPPANTVPFKIGEQPPPAGTKNPFEEYDLSKPNSFRTNSLPAGITQAYIDDPNQMVRDALKGQHIMHITRLITTTAGSNGPGVNNIPFITENANSLSLESVFAIETIQDASGSEFLQMQYSQTALINFCGMSFPHVTVGTLMKAF